MKAITGLVISFVCLGQGNQQVFHFNSRVGVVEPTESKQLCLIISNESLTAGSRVNLVAPENRQSSATAIVKERLSHSCSRNPDTGDASFYLLQLVQSDGRFRTRTQTPLIGVISGSLVRVRNGMASADFDRDGIKEFFRVCTSNEGLHFTIWSGRPLRGKRRWHSYYYLGYDVVPSCRPRDYR